MGGAHTIPNRLAAIATALSERVEELSFAEPVACVYNPLRYAWEPHRAYLELLAGRPGRVALVGMNPGPWGMTQTGVPFGEISMVRDWMGIEGTVGKPAREHPKRPVEGFSCTRSEVSGRRLWGWARERFGEPRRFFERFIVLNYCPLVFLEDTGRNRTPDRLPASEREPLFAACDAALAATVELLRPRLVVGIGTFAEGRARKTLGETVPIGRILHPSPASPAANRDWSGAVEKELTRLGVLG